MQAIVKLMITSTDVINGPLMVVTKDTNEHPTELITQESIKATVVNLCKEVTPIHPRWVDPQIYDAIITQREDLPTINLIYKATIPSDSPLGKSYIWLPLGTPQQQTSQQQVPEVALSI
jgi:hypothetical protein